MEDAQEVVLHTHYIPRPFFYNLLVHISSIAQVGIPVVDRNREHCRPIVEVTSKLLFITSFGEQRAEIDRSIPVIKSILLVLLFHKLALPFVAIVNLHICI